MLGGMSHWEPPKQQSTIPSEGIKGSPLPIKSQLDFFKWDSKSDPISSFMFLNELSALNRLDLLGS